MAGPSTPGDGHEPHAAFWTGLAQSLMTVCADRVRLRSPPARENGTDLMRALQEHFGGTLGERGERCVLTFSGGRKAMFLAAMEEHKDGATNETEWARGYFLGAAHVTPGGIEVTRTADEALIARLRNALATAAPHLRLTGSSIRIAVYEKASREYVRTVWMAYPPAPEMSVNDANARADKRAAILMISSGNTVRTPQPRLTDAMKARVLELWREHTDWSLATIAHTVSRAFDQSVKPTQVRHLLEKAGLLITESRHRACQMPEDIKRRVLADLSVHMPADTIRMNIIKTGIAQKYVPAVSTIKQLLKPGDRLPPIDPVVPTWFELEAKYHLPR